ncbi:MAG: glutamine-hydrolyzing carbamoyl-phosphate synthase small subunit [Spirochaetales bacterium]|nr:glutamine-hydrolyzing carbamoyl-phosphate synthase small subunit [Spirochaetales bacterium]
MHDRCFLVLDDGSVYRGKSFGYQAPRAGELDTIDLNEKSAGEVVFNTGMTGYCEILTDPSYTGQIVVMTYPMIGNYGTDDGWSEGGPEPAGRCMIKAAGFVTREVYEGPIPRGRISLDQFMKRHRTPGIWDVDTRALTLRIRNGGSTNGLILRANDGGSSLSGGELEACMRALAQFPRMVGRNLIGNVGVTGQVRQNPEGSPHFLLIDCGIKANIIRELVDRGCKLTILPSGAGSAEIMAAGADALLLSNGPGDPAVLESLVATVRSVIGEMPVYGVCLGHQLISLALGARTMKMKFGHHGVNHPVRDEFTGRVFVTSQNHGFAVEQGSLPGTVDVWFRNANDKSIEGIRHKTLPVMCAQFHPEAAPGPRDSSWIFDEFIESARGYNNKE